jgi:hypothetical protein
MADLPGSSGDGGRTPEPTTLVWLGANVTGQAHAALLDAAAVTGLSQAATVTQALQAYAYFVGARHAGDRIWAGRRRWRSREVTTWFPEP